MKTNPYLQLHCISPLAPYAEDYVSQKRALGNKCRSEVEILNMFDAFCVERGLSTAALSQELYDEWCAKRPHENSTTQRVRVQHLRSFARFISNNGAPAPAIFLPLPPLDKPFVPYIFTHTEIERFLSAVDNTKACVHYGRPSLAHLIMPVLFRILYCCGLRIGETLKLKTDDVDLDNGIIRLSQTKGNRERLIPMSATLKELCAEYRSNQRVADYGSEYFFPASDNLHYAVCTVYERFREYLFAAGIGHGGRGKGPRLHDLRHTFAVHTLNKWAMEGRDLYVALPILCDYLGHENMESTEKYLRLVPEAHALLIRPFEEKFGSVFPEVTSL
jgi:integrase